MNDTRLIPIKLCVYQKERTNSVGEPMILISCYQIPHAQYTTLVEAHVDPEGNVTSLDTDGCFITTVGDCGIEYPQRRFFPWDNHSTLCYWEAYLTTLGFHFKMTLPADLVTDGSSYDSSRCRLKMKNILKVILNTKRYM